MIARDNAARGASGIAAKLRDASGASVVIALVFFLICAVLGTVVLTAASVNAKAARTHEDLQQAEFSVGSAAQAIGYKLDSARLIVEKDPKGALTAKLDESVFPSSLAQMFWDAYGSKAMQAHESGEALPALDVTVDAVTSDNGATDPVYGKLSIDSDLNITIRLSLSSTFAADSPYNMTVGIQCIPTYSAKGELEKFSYEWAVVQRDGAL